jgi:hypothetical protein
MRKIPTALVRDPDDRAHVLMEVTPGCEWVFAGEGAATRKYDGTCVMFDGLDWWARREVKPGKQSPPRFRAIETDVHTGKTVGWEPIAQSAFVKYFWEALPYLSPLMMGTYELVGPKINGNPEGAKAHSLIRHETATRFRALDHPSSPEALAAVVKGLSFEGIVWHRIQPDGSVKMAKLKRKDIK